MHALIAENNAQLGSAMVRGLAGDSISADLVSSAHEVLQRATANDYGAIVLDARLPDLEPPRLCREIRHEQVCAPIILLARGDSVEDRVAVLDSGADDCMAMPFSLRELSARIRAISRRGPLRDGVMLRSGDLELDPVRHQVRRDDTPIDLSKIEFDLLQALMRDSGAVLSRSHLLQQAWGYGYETRSNVVEVYVRYLREKIDRPFDRHSLQTVRGVGYRLCGED